MSHNFMELSQLPLAMVFPSADMATEETENEWPVRDWISLPVFMSHSFMELSPLPLARVFPSGDIATEETGSE